MKRKTSKDWDPPIFAGFPVGLYMHPSGANRHQRRAMRDHKHDPMPPSSMTPAIKKTHVTKDKVVTKYVSR